jgi:hypothetical protein
MPKAAQLETKIDPVEHCRVTRGMVLEDRKNFAGLERNTATALVQVDGDLIDHAKRITKLEKSRISAGMMWWGTEIVLCGGVVYLLMAKFQLLP